jgi:hypothetical protein
VARSKTSRISGYVILHQGGGTVISASDTDQMKVAIKRWLSTAKKTKDGLAFPVGITTSYRVIK